MDGLRLRPVPPTEHAVGRRPNIDAAAKWVWYSSNGDPDPTTPGFDHDEWLVFRISVAASGTGQPRAARIGFGRTGCDAAAQSLIAAINSRSSAPNAKCPCQTSRKGK